MATGGSPLGQAEVNELQRSFSDLRNGRPTRSLETADLKSKMDLPNRRKLQLNPWEKITKQNPQISAFIPQSILRC